MHYSGVSVLFGKFPEILRINSVRLSTPQKSFIIGAVKIELGTNNGVLLEIGTFRGKPLEGHIPVWPKILLGSLARHWSFLTTSWYLRL